MSTVSDKRVALLRGINVGKAKRVAMADLRALVEDLGYEGVRTLLNSGNIIFTVPKRRSGDPASRIEQAIAKKLNVATRVTVLTGKEIVAAVHGNPLAEVADDPSHLLVMVLKDPAAHARLKPLLKDRWAPEALALGKGVAYLWCAKGIVDSPLWAAVTRIIGDGGTARNMATMIKLVALVEGS